MIKLVDSVSMSEVGTTQLPGRRAKPWRWALAGLLLVCLIHTLATRFTVTIQHTATAQSSSLQATRQHMDRDAVRWVDPVLQFTLLQAPSFYPRIALGGPPLPTVFIEDNLYDRPPPAC
jgi:hypothetical protein